MQREQKITLREMRESGPTRLICGDYRCAHSSWSTPVAGAMKCACPAWSRNSRVRSAAKKGPLRFLMALPPYDAPHPTLELPFWVQKWSKLPAYLACCFGPRQHTVRQIAGRSKILLRRFPASRGQ